MKRYAFTGILAAVALVAGLMLYLVQPSMAQPGYTGFTSIRTTNSAIIGNDLSVTDDTSTNDLNVVADVWTRNAATATMTSGGTLTPAGQFQPISSAGTVGFGVIAGCSAANAGRRLTVVNGANQTITITETGNLKMAGNFALGQYDAIEYVCDAAANWVETNRANN